jgi:hypothetical protein
MALTEMMQSVQPLSQTRLGTPLNSPSLPSLNPSTSDDVQPAPSLQCSSSDPSVKNSVLQTPSPPVTLKDLEQLFLKFIQSKDSTEASDGAKADAKPSDAQPKLARASKLEFKIVNEVYVFN